MLADKTSSAILAVSDLDRARVFYRDLLGLELVEDGEMEVLVFRTGATHLVVYRSAEAGTNRANAVVWDAGEDIEAIAADLKARGAIFEHYPDIDPVRHEDGIHRVEGMKLLWLKDPDGNILHINAMPRAA